MISQQLYISKLKSHFEFQCFQACIIERHLLSGQWECKLINILSLLLLRYLLKLFIVSSFVAPFRILFSSNWCSLAFKIYPFLIWCNQSKVLIDLLHPLCNIPSGRLCLLLYYQLLFCLQCWHHLILLLSTWWLRFFHPIFFALLPN